jgi:pimeloyl-ACP methyl ester carboxylesterase
MLVGAPFVLGHIALAQPAPEPAVPAAAPQQPPGRGPVDPRVEQRTYTFAETNEQMPYALFVSSKVTKDKKSPLIVSLHGLGGDQNTMVRESLRSVELAEQGGYILVAPMGYNSAGWYGIPPGPPRPPNANAPQRGPGPGATPRPVIGGTAITDPAKVREASERDVMTVLDLIRKEFNVDERRTYLMGHSMGGAGTYYLGSKHGDVWAALVVRGLEEELPSVRAPDRVADLIGETGGEVSLFPRSRSEVQIHERPHDRIHVRHGRLELGIDHSWIGDELQVVAPVG